MIYSEKYHSVPGKIIFVPSARKLQIVLRPRKNN
ncbi:hypothetical protein SAMN06265171_102194 [Chryseobacterium rhizoplanae]|uniref:Uncharacterized protein n=1 Tax=Chryseobacterium rhizoplanae TaxID=1609531 RepID=A0A521BWJ5_9FLAO|nr:hypothetical protein SAMN06265171_102194 [Chryseobacterium rhizoplanae]